VRNSVYVAGVAVVAAGAAAIFFATHRGKPEAALGQQWDMLHRYCSDCHNNSDLTADLSFDGRVPGNVHTDPATWEKVLHKLEIGAMPPRKEPQPTKEARAKFIDALTGTLDANAAAHPYAGSTKVHRLNRAEYRTRFATCSASKPTSRISCRATAATSASTTSRSC